MSLDTIADQREPTVPRFAEEVLVGRRASYRVVAPKPIGEGGMGWVLECQDLVSEIPVAIKVLKESWLRERFEQEAELGFGLRHPNLMQVHDAGHWEDRPFFVMDLLHGTTLDACLETPGRTGHQGPTVSPTEVTARYVRMAIYVARGLALLHSRGFVHRDVKPSNIFLCLDSSGNSMEPKLLDFGIAKSLLGPGRGGRTSTEHGRPLGSKHYCPPEQQRGDLDRLDYRSDIWALGAVLFHLIEGRPVDSIEPTRLSSAEPPSDRWAPDLWLAVGKALRPDLERRPATVGDFARALQPFTFTRGGVGLTFDLHLPPVQARREPPQAPLPKFSKLAEVKPAVAPPGTPSQRLSGPPSMNPWVIALAGFAAAGFASLAYTAGSSRARTDPQNIPPRMGSARIQSNAPGPSGGVISPSVEPSLPPLISATKPMANAVRAATRHKALASSSPTPSSSAGVSPPAGVLATASVSATTSESSGRGPSAPVATSASSVEPTARTQPNSTGGAARHLRPNVPLP